MRASSPTEVCGVVKFAVSRVATGPARFVGEGHGPPAGPYTATFSRLVSMFSPFRRAGVHARRTLANSKMEGLRHCRGRVFPVSRGPCPVRRGGFHIRPGRLCRRTVRRGEGTPPYGRPVGRGCPGWPKTQNLFVGAGFTAPAGAFRRPTAAQRRLLGRRSRPRNPAPPQTGPIWNRPLQRFATLPGSRFPG